MLRFACSIFMGKRWVCVCASATIWSTMIKWMKHKQMKNINRPKKKIQPHKQCGENNKRIKFYSYMSTTAIFFSHSCIFNCPNERKKEVNSFVFFFNEISVWLMLLLYIGYLQAHSIWDILGLLNIRIVFET